MAHLEDGNLVILAKLANYIRRMAIAASLASSEHREGCYYCSRGDGACFTAQMLTSKEYRGWVTWHKVRSTPTN